MSTDANELGGALSNDAASDDEVNVIAFAQIGESLADQVVAVLPGWVHSCIRRFIDPPDPVAVAQASADALQLVEGPLRALLATDLDQQRGTPLAIIRRAVACPTAVLVDHGIEPVERDPFAERSFPEDHYDLSPGSWSDIDPSLADIGLRWSVAKAFLHRQRHATQT
jgi:hypothetical protein